MPQSPERRALWLVKAFLGDERDHPDDDSGMRALVRAVDEALRGEPVSYRAALRLAWADVYYGLRDRKGYDPCYAQYRADSWVARRTREARRRKARAHGTPRGWLTMREAGAALGVSGQAVAKMLGRGALPDLLPETVEAARQRRKEPTDANP